MRSFAWEIAAGVAAIIAGPALATLAEGLVEGPGIELAQFLAVATGIVVGLAFLVPGGLSHVAFRKSHPYIEDFYSQADRARSARELAVVVVAGITSILIGIALVLTGKLMYGHEDGWWDAGVLFGAAIGGGLFAWGGIRHRRFDIEAYNRERKQAMKTVEKPISSRVARICGVVMLVATIIGLSALFLSLPWVHDSALARAISGYFWFSWVIGGLVCGIIALLLDHEDEDSALPSTEHNFDDELLHD